MLSLYFRIVELITEEKRSSMNPLYVYVKKSEGPNVKLTKLKMLTNKKDNNLKNDKTIVFELTTQNNNYLYLEIKRHRVIVADDLIGKLTLPLEWFPTNHVVREWFPFKESSKKNKNVMILLDIHIDARKVTPFMAPFATLRVLPYWKRPTKTDNADFAVQPPMVYVLSTAEQRTVSIQQLRQMASAQQLVNQNNVTVSNAQPLPQGYTPAIATQNQLNPNQSTAQQQNQLQRSQSLRQQTPQSSQRPQSQTLSHRQTTNIRPPPLPSYPQQSSDDELEKDEEEQQRQQNQQNVYQYYSPSSQPYQNIYSPPVIQSDEVNNNSQYSAPEYYPPQGNPSNNPPTYTPSIY